ncbi:MAG: ATP synthase subunit I [Nitrosomonas sp.]|nr:ATP synthase subunit I [Nitrosomonas sp.]
MFLIKNRPLKIVTLWQIYFALMVVIGSSLYWGIEAAISGFLGVAVSVVAGVAYAAMLSRHKGYSASGVLRTALRAEAVKLLVIIVSLWLVFVMYKGLQPVIFIGSFIVAVLISSMAVFVPEKIHK